MLHEARTTTPPHYTSLPRARRAIVTEPEFFADKRDALIGDMENYLKILKSVSWRGILGNLGRRNLARRIPWNIRAGCGITGRGVALHTVHSASHLTATAPPALAPLPLPALPPPRPADAQRRRPAVLRLGGRALHPRRRQGLPGVRAAPKKNLFPPTDPKLLLYSKYHVPIVLPSSLCS